MNSHFTYVSLFHLCNFYSSPINLKKARFPVGRYCEVMPRQWLLANGGKYHT